MRRWLWQVVLFVIVTALTVLHNTPVLAINLGNIYVTRLVIRQGSANVERASWATQARNYYGWALLRAPERADLWMRSAEVDLTNRAWRQAQEHYAEFRSRGGNTRQAWVRLRAIVSQLRWCGAENQEILQVAEQLESESQAYRLVGDGCMAGSNRDASIEAYEQAFKLSPSYDLALSMASALLQRAEAAPSGQSMQSATDYGEIINLIEQTLPSGQDAAKGNYLLALSYWRTNQFDQALKSYQSCLAQGGPFSNDGFVCALHLGHAYSMWLPASMQDSAKALAYYQQAESLATAIDANPFEAQQGLGKLWLERDQPATAYAYLVKALSSQPACTECRLLLGNALLRLGRNCEARQQFDYVLRQSPGEPRAQEALKQIECRP